MYSVVSGVVVFKLACTLIALWPYCIWADALCEDYEQFAQYGWEHEQVQNAMDVYLRDHRMHANWLNQPAPPDQIGSDYYQWLWHNRFGAVMKRDVTQQFCERNNAESTD